MLEVIFGLALVALLILIMVAISSVSDWIKNEHSKSVKQQLLSNKTNLQFKECEARKFLYKHLNNYNDFNEYLLKKEELSKPLVRNICDSDEEYKIEVNNRKNDYIYNKIRRYDIPINELYNLSYDQENELLVFTGLPFKNSGYSIHTGKLNSGGKLISSCFGQSYISNDSNINISLLFNHFGSLPSFSFPIKREICKKILNINGIRASIVLEINNVYHKHEDNSSMAYTNAMIQLREYDTIEILCNLKGITINMVEIDEDTNEIPEDFINTMIETNEDPNELLGYFIRIKCFETI